MQSFSFGLEMPPMGSALGPTSKFSDYSLFERTDPSKPSTGQNEFERFVNRSMSYKAGAISYGDFVADVNRWFPLFSQFNQVSMQLRLEAPLPPAEKQKSSSPPPARQPAASEAAAEKPGKQPLWMNLRSKPRGRPKIFLPKKTPTLEEKAIARSLAQNLTQDEIKKLGISNARVPRVSGKICRIKSFWKLRDDGFPFVFQRNYFFVKRDTAEGFEVEYVDLTGQNLAKGAALAPF